MFYIEYQRFIDLYNSQKINSKITELPNHQNFSQIEFLNEIKKILALKNPVTKEENLFKTDKENNIKVEKLIDNNKNIIYELKKEKELNEEDFNERNNINKKPLNREKEDNKELRTLEEIKGNYVFTSDNYIKMVLIILRIRESVPIIMMGETGCGKTALIRKLSKLLNNGNIKMKILNIHAGTDNEDIIKFIEKIIPEAKKLEEEEKKKKEYNKKLGIEYD